MGGRWVGLQPGLKMGIVSGMGLDIPGKHNKAAAFTFKRRGDGLFLPPPRRHTPPWFVFIIVFPEQCHVLPGPAGSQRPSLALTFGTSETQSEGGREGWAEVLASAHVTFPPGGLFGVVTRREQNTVVKGQNDQTRKQLSHLHQKSGQLQEPTSGTTFIHHHVQQLNLPSPLWFYWHKCTHFAFTA